MISERDIYAAAKIYIKRYGETAATEAAMRADEFRKKNEFEGQRVWDRIVDAINELQRIRTPEDAVN